MAGPAKKKGTTAKTVAAKRKNAEAKSLVAYRAGERVTKPKYGPPAPVKRKNVPTKRGATVGDAIDAAARGFGTVVKGATDAVQGALGKSPGLRSQGIDNVMKLPSKRR